MECKIGVPTPVIGAQRQKQAGPRARLLIIMNSNKILCDGVIIIPFLFYVTVAYV